MKAKSTSKFELDGIPPLKEAIPLGYNLNGNEGVCIRCQHY
ncbi:hypothetical protein QKA_2533 [Clostridioides difficile DA00165]|nr:hypothetical protein QKA_2533 [Clostridioides difficile DA00165]